MSLKNLLIRMACPPLPRWEKTGRSLVVSTTGLGDSLWGTPAIRELAKRERVSVLTSPVGAEVFRNNPHVQEIFLSGRQLWKKRFDTVYLFHASQRIMPAVAYWTGAARRVGTRCLNKGLDSLFTELHHNAREHELLRRFQLAGVDGSPQMELFLTEEEERLADLFEPGGPLVGLHPGSKDRFKRWDPAHFIQVGRRFEGAQVIVTGNEGERELVTHVAKGIPGAKVAILPLRVFAALVKRMKVFITNDTGPMHVAFAMNTPTVGLFCATDPNMYGPLTGNHRIIHVKKTCMPCLKKKCRRPFCLEQISEEEVWNASASLFSIGMGKMTPSPV